MDIVLAQSAEVQEFVDGGVFQTQLCQTSCLLDFVALGAGRSEAVGAQVFADVGRVGGVIVGVAVKPHKSVNGLENTFTVRYCIPCSHCIQVSGSDLRRSSRVVDKRRRVDGPVLLGRESSHGDRRRAVITRREEMKMDRRRKRERDSGLMYTSYQTGPMIHQGGTSAHHPSGSERTKLAGRRQDGGRSGHSKSTSMV